MLSVNGQAAISNVQAVQMPATRAAPSSSPSATPPSPRRAGSAAPPKLTGLKVLNPQ